MPDIDKLQIKIKSESTHVAKSLDELIDRLNRVSTAIGTVDSGNVNTFADSLTRLSNSMNTIKSVDKRTFSSLVGKLNSLARVDSSGVRNTANSLHNMASAIGKISGIQTGAQDIATLANAIAKLGYKSVTQAITNIPLLASAMNNLITSLSRAPAVSRNVIDLTNALSNLSNQGSRVGTATRSMNRAMNNFSKTSETVGKSARSLASAFGKFYATYFLAIRGVQKLWKGVEASMNYVETYNYFKVTFDKINREFNGIGSDGATNYYNGFQKQMEELLSKMTGYKLGDNGELFNSGSIGLGLDPNQLMQFQAKVGAVTNSVGLIGQASIDTSKALSMLVADISSLTNTDIGTVMTNLSSGIIGQSRALYKYGIDITNNTLQQYALAEGIEKSVSEMTQAEKMQLRLLAILDQSRVAWADQANTINSVANQYRIFQQQSANLGRTLGNLVLPMVQNLLPYLNGLVIAMSNVLTTFGFKIHGDNWLASLNDGTSDGASAIEEIEDALDRADESATKLKKNLMGFDELNVIDSNKTNSGIATLGQIDLSGSMHNALLDYEKVWDDAIKSSKNKAQQLSKIIEQNITKMLGNLPDKVLNLANSISKVGDSLKPFTDGFGNGFVGFLRSISEIALDTISTALRVFGGALDLVDTNRAEAVGKAIGIILASLLYVKGVQITATVITSILTALKGGLTGLAAVISTNPVLATFVLAGGILALIKMATGEKKSDGLGEFAARVQELADAYDNAMKTFKKGSGALELEALYEKWRSLNDTVGELSTGDSALIKQYADRIKELCPEAGQYIDENGRSYAGVADAIDKAIQKTKEYYKEQARSNLMSELVGLQLDYEVELSINDSNIQSIIKKIQEIIPNATEADIYKNVGAYTFNAMVSNGKLWNTDGKFLANLSKAEEKAVNTLLKELSSAENAQAEYLKGLEKTEEKIRELSRIMGEEIGQKAPKTFEELANTIKGGVSKELTDGVTAIRNFFDSIKTNAHTSLSAVNELETALKNLNNISLPSVPSAFSLKDKTSRFLPYGQYAVGGFPEDGWFRASHGEIMGRFDNGQSVVANNNQITSGIADAVYPAVYNAMMNAFSNSNNGNLSVQIDGREVFKATRKYASEYQRTTGNQAFSF